MTMMTSIQYEYHSSRLTVAIMGVVIIQQLMLISSGSHYANYLFIYYLFIFEWLTVQIMLTHIKIHNLQ